MEAFVNKIGGENATEFQKNFNDADRVLKEGKAVALVFSALRSSAFNTTSRLISLAKNLVQGEFENAQNEILEILNFSRTVIEENVEPEFVEPLLGVLTVEIDKYLKLTGEIKNLDADERKSRFFNKENEWLYRNRHGEYIPLTGFGEILSSKLYFQYFKSRGLNASLLDSTNAVHKIFADRPKEAFERNGSTIEDLIEFYKEKIFEAHSNKNTQLFITGGWAPGIADKRQYSDINGSLLAVAMKRAGYSVKSVIRKKLALMSADPRLIPVEELKLIKRINYRLAAELFGFRSGADAGAVHPYAIPNLEENDIETLIIGENGTTSITPDYKPEKGKTEIVAGRKVPMALEISSSRMAVEAGVIAKLTEILKNISISQIYPTESSFIIAFDSVIPEEQINQIMQALGTTTTVQVRRDLALIFCLSNNMNVMKENAFASFALIEAGISSPGGNFKDPMVVSFLVFEADMPKAVKVLHHSLIHGFIPN